MSPGEGYSFAPVRALSTAAASAILLFALASPAAADGTRWRTIVGIEQAGNLVGTIAGGGQPWTTLGGEARVDLSGGHVEFEVRGLVLNGSNAIGTPDAITQVRGTLVCDAGAKDQAIADTPLVTLSAQGDAEFEGDITIPPTCTPANVAFLVRIPAGRWIANGAVRSP